MEDTATEVLLIEDDPGSALMCEARLSEHGKGEFVVTHATCLRDALGILENLKFDVILLDLKLPDINGLATFTAVHAVVPQVPIVVLSATDDDLMALQAVREGAQDYLVNGRIDGAQLVRAVRHAIERSRRQRELERLSFLDELTQVYNLRGFLALARKAQALARRRKSPMLLIAADVDGLKQINDNQGHRAGSRVLQEVATVLKDVSRKSDLVGRLGGDEFIVLMVDAASENLDCIRDRIVARFDALNVRGSVPYFLGCSIGLVRWDADNDDTLETLLARADDAMYADKRRRRQTSGMLPYGR